MGEVVAEMEVDMRIPLGPSALTDVEKSRSVEEFLYGGFVFRIVGVESPVPVNSGLMAAAKLQAMSAEKR